MKLVVFGSTGGIGSKVVEQALAAGHEVTAVARRPSAITLKHEHLEVVQGDVLEPETIRRIMAGKDAVVSALGVHNRAPTTVYSDGVAHIVQAMQPAHVRRLFCISASGIEPGPFWQRLIARPLLWAFLKEMYSDLVRMEALVRRSAVDWTILRPPRLTNGPRTGHYQVAVNKHLRKCFLISRADVADYVVGQLDRDDSRCAVVELAY